MRIHYPHIGPVIRIVGEITWSAENGHTAEVSGAATLAELLTAPGGEFQVAQDEPMLALAGMTTDLLVALAMEGVACVGDIHKFAKTKGAAQRLGVEPDLLAQWVATAEKE